MSTTLHTDQDARRQPATERGKAGRLSSRRRSRTGNRANGRTRRAGGPRNKVTTPEPDHGRPEPDKMPQPHGSPPLGFPARITAGVCESRGPEGEGLRRPGKWPPDIRAR
eukprot:11448821-Alexandrium_andersonii.AAC.1